MELSRKTTVALVAVLLTIAALWFTQRAVAPKQATWEDVKAEAERGGYRILRIEELASRYLEDPEGLVLVDTRQEWEYRSGHIAGAVNFPMEPTWWARWRKADDLEAFLGPDRERTIVFY